MEQRARWSGGSRQQNGSARRGIRHWRHGTVSAGLEAAAQGFPWTQLELLPHLPAAHPSPAVVVSCLPQRLPARPPPVPQVNFRHTVRYSTDKQLFIAPEGVYSGQYIYCGKKATLNIGNVKPVSVCGCFCVWVGGGGGGSSVQ